jgi:hypothetical protein
MLEAARGYAVPVTSGCSMRAVQARTGPHNGAFRSMYRPVGARRASARHAQRSSDRSCLLARQKSIDTRLLGPCESMSTWSLWWQLERARHVAARVRRRAPRN